MQITKIRHYYVPLFALGIIAQMLCFKSRAKAQNICFKKLVNIDFDIMQKSRQNTTKQRTLNASNSTKTNHK